MRMGHPQDIECVKSAPTTKVFRLDTDDNQDKENIQNVEIRIL